MKLMQQFSLLPEEIYHRSFATVDALLPSGTWSPEERHIIRRIVHATGDPQLATAVRFKPEAISAGITAFHHRASLFTDVHMVAAGIQKQWCDALGCTIQVLIAQDGLTDIAAAAQITRSAAAMLKALPLLGGNALDEGRCEPPALILGMPVGFIATREAKDALWERSYPAIIVEGTRGGSPVAAATVNALLDLARQALVDI